MDPASSRRPHWLAQATLACQGLSSDDDANRCRMRKVNALLERRGNLTSGKQHSHGKCEDADQRACFYASVLQLCENARVRTACSRSCGRCATLRGARPRVFLYPNQGYERGFQAIEANTLMARHYYGYPHYSNVGDGWALAPGETTRHGNFLAPLLYQRLSEYAVPAEKADIFIAFQAPFLPPFHNWTAAELAEVDRLPKSSVADRTGVEVLSIKKACEELVADANGSNVLLRSLRYFGPLTEQRHFVVPHFHSTHCQGEGQFTTWRRPSRTLELRLLELDVDGEPDSGEDTPERPMLYRMPFMGSVRWSSQFNETSPWKLDTHNSRSRLISFCGSANGSPIAKRIRGKIIELVTPVGSRTPLCRRAAGILRLFQSHPGCD